MLFIKIYRYILGYIRIKIAGRFKERFINLLTQQKISFWDISKKKDDIFCYMMAKDYKKVRGIVKKSKVKSKVVERYGLIFKIRKYKKRWGLLIGFFTVFTLFLISSQLVLTIDIEGNNDVDDSVIESALRGEGFKAFTLYDKLDIDKIEENVLLKVPELSWISINVKGVNAVIDVKERTPVPDIYISDGNGHLISNSDAIITEMLVYGGVNVVKTGDVVAKGDMLVSGHGVTEEGLIIEQKAYGDVYGMVEENINFVVNRAKNDIIESKSVVNTIYEVLGFKVPFIKQKNINENDEVILKNEHITVFGMKMPIIKHTQEIITHKYNPRVLSDQEIKKELQIELNKHKDEIEKTYKILDVEYNEILENDKGILSCRIYIEKKISDFIEIS